MPKGRLFIRVAIALALSVTGTARAQNRCYLVCAGVTNYATDAKIPPLRFAARDARDLAFTLQVGARVQFGEANTRVFLLTGERETLAVGAPAASEPLGATKTNFLAVFREITRRARRDDTVLVILAGHGVPLGAGEYAYLTQDAASADLTDSPFRADWTLSRSELCAWMNALPCAHKALVLDTCAAGAFAAEKADAPQETADWSENFEEAAFPVLMGSAANAASHESARFGHGLLSYALLEGVRQKGEIRLQNWFSTAATRAPQLADELRDAQQPRVSWPANVADFAFARFADAELAQLPSLGRAPLLVPPRFSLLDDPGGTLEIALERAVTAALQSAQQRGEVQLVPRDQAADFPAAWRASGHISGAGASCFVQLTLKTGAAAPAPWKSAGDAGALDVWGARIAAEIIAHCARGDE